MKTIKPYRITSHTKASSSRHLDLNKLLKDWWIKKQIKAKSNIENEK